ncbi:MAG TPA: 4-hydroxy-3-methylbut-2-enyl diphosphate reductase, partial [Blastocatellia bacterium]|nr:4-hydroxy-3-methylbut-2-enyl diphosphate reductase [Blastocatellia bacterium]
DASCIESASRIRHKPVGQSDEVASENWLPSGDVIIGITAGASTPDRLIGEVIERIVNYCVDSNS